MPSLTLKSLLVTISNYYTSAILRKVLPFFDLSPSLIPPQEFTGSSDEERDWISLQGQITADLQVFASQRLFLRALRNGGTDEKRVWRYRIEWVPDAVRESNDPESVTFMPFVFQSD
jgi:hypothetical protein